MVQQANSEIRRIHELNDLKTTDWNSAELHYHQRVMSDLSPWLNAQGTAMLGQIISEIEHRGGDRSEHTNT
ncbi:hypothetical protein [Paenibacillus cremeus]|uniref:Uncharacterized protein n=1 Tax=Paenibacillus cremeus TaxID=2163881 RepID=A0A559KDK2_9BACL|nr:hypothetical protein [Paenibacillus cremeus]TVY10195.1 hypothetical protein FPZ49_08960 [Paenibacillus cremeus]